MELLRDPAHHGEVCDHLVQVYREPRELAESVATYLAAGFEAGEPAIVIATAAHRPIVEERLQSRGWSAAALEADGMLVDADAEEVRTAITGDGQPSLRLFASVVGGLMDRAAARSAGRRIRVFGEVVEVLCRAGEEAAADRVEQFWNRLGMRRDFSLLCGYRIDVFDRRSELTLLPQVCRSHSQVLPAADPVRMERAVDTALVETLGLPGAQKVYAQVARQVRWQQVPAAQLALMWVSAQMPRAAERILAAARTHYLDTHYLDAATV